MAQIRVELQLADGSFVSGLLRAGQSVQDFRRELARLDPHFRELEKSGAATVTGFRRLDAQTRSLGAQLRDISVIAGGATLAFHALTGASSGLIGSIVKVNADIERLRFQMEAMSTAANPFQEAQANVDHLRQMIKEVPFSLKELSNSFVKLRASGIDPMAGSLQALTDGISAFGGTDEQLHRVTLGIQQMAGKSVIQMEEMRQQLGESMPSAMRIMAQSMGVSVSELTQAISTGRLRAKPALEAFFLELDRSFGGTAQRMMQTFSGQVTQMYANLQVLATDTAVADFVNVTLKNLLRGFNDFLKTEQARDMADSIGRSFNNLANAGAVLATTIFNLRGELMTIGTALAAGMLLRGIGNTFAALQLKLSELTLAVTTAGTRIGTTWDGTTAHMAQAQARTASTITAINAQTAASMAALQSRAQITALGIQAAAVTQRGAISRNAAAATQTLLPLKTQLAAVALQMRINTIQGHTFGLMLGRTAPAAMALSRTLHTAQVGVTGFGAALRTALVTPVQNANVALGAMAATARTDLTAMARTMGATVVTAANSAAISTRAAAVAFGTHLAGAARIAGSAMMGAARTMIAFTPMVLAAAPTVLALGAALYATANHFGLFKNKAREAYEEIKQYGAESRAEALRLSKELEADINRQIDNVRSQFGFSISPLYQQQEAALLQQLAAVLQEREELLSKSAANEDQAQRTQIERQMSERQAAAQRDYAERKNELEKWIEAEQAAMNESGKTKLEINTEYQDKLREAQKTLVGSQLEVVKAMIAEQQTALFQLGSDQLMADAITARLVILSEHLEQLRGQMIAIEQGEFKLEFGADIENEAAKVKKGQQALANLLEEVAGLEAELNGASGEFAELMTQIRRGDFGSLEDGTEEVQKLAAALQEAAAKKEILDGLMDGRKKIERDIEKARQELLDRQIELLERQQGRVLSEPEKIKLRLENGYYKGLGPVEDIQAAIDELTDKINTQGLVVNEVAKAMQDGAFGAATVGKVETAKDAIDQMTASVRGLAAAINEISFGNFAADGWLGGSIAGAPVGASANAMINGIITQAVGMNEGAALGSLQDFLEKGGQGGVDPRLVAWCAAFVNATLNMAGMEGTGSLAARSFLNWGAPVATPQRGDIAVFSRGSNEEQGHVGFFQGYDENGNIMVLGGNQGDAVNVRPYAANRLLGFRRAIPQGLAGAGAVGPAAAPAASYTYVPPPELIEQQRRATEEYVAALDRMIPTDEAMRQQEWAQDRVEALTELRAKLDEVNAGTGELRKNEMTLAASIRDGKLGGSKDPAAAEYAELLAAARALDDAEEQLAERKKARTAATRETGDLEQRRVELAQRLADERARMQDPDYVAEAAELRRLNEEFDDYIANVAVAYGTDSAEYKAALDQKVAALQEFRQLDAVSRAADMVADRRAIEDSLMTRSQLKRTQLQREMKAVDDLVERMRAAGMQEIEIAEFVEAQKAAIRAKYDAELNPLAGQMKEWGDLQGNLIEKSTQWTDSLASGVAGLITGTGSLKSAIDGILNDVVNMGVRYLFQGMAGDKAAAVGGNLAAANPGNVFGKAASKIGTKGKVGIGLRHTGGMVGEGHRAVRMVSPGLFANAQRWHGGGVLGRDLKAGEVPIIAKNDEGIFTKEQMKALAPVGAMGGVQIHAPVTINSNGGTPEQNADLARQAARELEATMRSVVARELQRAMRPGGMMNQG